MNEPIITRRTSSPHDPERCSPRDAGATDGPGPSRRQHATRGASAGRLRGSALSLFTFAALTGPLLFLLTHAPACDYGDGFRCGEPVPGTDNTFRQCDGTEQVCVCATNSCAERVETTKCASGLRYLDPPFAREGIGIPAPGAGLLAPHNCVSTLHTEWILAEGAGNVACGTSPDAGVDAGEGGGDGSGGAGGDGGAGGGAGMGGGGMGGDLGTGGMQGTGGMMAGGGTP